MARNLLQLREADSTFRGVHYTLNPAAGTMTLEGAITEYDGASIRVGTCVIPENTTVTIEGLPEGVGLRDEDGNWYDFEDVTTTLHRLPVTITASGFYNVWTNIPKDTYYAGNVFYPMIREAYPENSHIIEIGSVLAPTVMLDTASLDSLSEETATSIIGDELTIDTLTPVAHYEVFPRRAFKPRDYNLGILTADGLIFCGHYNYDIRKLPYGTRVGYYYNSLLQGEYYVKSVERTGRYQYQINGVSAIGMMDRQFHKGGIYTGQTFAEVLREIIGADYNYEMDEEVRTQPVYGWLPYATRRRNLHQLLFAYGVSLLKRGKSDTMNFTFLKNYSLESIPDDRIFTGGRVEYPTPASRVEVAEHAFHYLANVEDVLLFDNTGEDSVTNALVTFDEPIYPESIHAGDTNLVIESYGTNYAYVSGIGMLYGKPYTHTMRVRSADNPDAVTEHVVRVEGATLVTMANSPFVLDRVAQYYMSAMTVTQDIRRINEQCGILYNLNNAYHEPISGFLKRMSTRTSSIRRAECEFVQGFNPKGNGITFKERQIFPIEDGQTRFFIFNTVAFSELHPYIRIVIIGAGADGSNGVNGEPGYVVSENQSGAGGLGGAGGAAGTGGRIYSVLLKSGTDWTGNELSFTFHGAGKAVTVSYHDRNNVHTGSYTSADGITSPTGYYDVMTDEVFALPGVDGVAGGNGGAGGMHRPRYGNPKHAQDGQNVTFDGHTYFGGHTEDPTRTSILEFGFGTVEWLYIYGSGGGGGGAAVGSNGGDGDSARPGHHQTSDHFNWGDNGGNGGNGADGLPASAMYGSGGNGGHGGGGGGGAGLITSYNEAYYVQIDQFGGTPGIGGSGGAGSVGTQGCVIIYY